MPTRPFRPLTRLAGYSNVTLLASRAPDAAAEVVQYISRSPMQDATGTLVGALTYSRSLDICDILQTWLCGC